MSIAENITHIREGIVRAAERSGRDPAKIELMGVSKTKPARDIAEAYAAGLALFGENYVQEWAEKKPQVPGGASVHLIGHLQSNKANRAVELFDAVDSLDSVKLAEKLNAAAARLNKTLPVLIEINVAGEESKSGLAPESPELEQLLHSAASWPNLRIEGLMSIPPLHEDPEKMRPYFRKLRELRDGIKERRIPTVSMDVLSMGMSGDFEVAIEEGATRIRVGTAIFGSRK